MEECEKSSPVAGSTASGEPSASSSGNQMTPPPEPAPKKKRNLPGMPDPDAEVIALSPKTLLATNRFVCEICNKGFQRDQNLQLHRRGHNLPWKLRQRTSKEVRKRVYVCPEPTCVHNDPRRALGDLTGIKKHFCRKHGEKKFKCERCSKKYAVQSDWKAHMKICGTREYRCDCGTLFSRRDSFITHRAFCDALAQESARSQTLPVSDPEEALKVQNVASSTSSPSPPPVTPSTGVLSPVRSIQSSEAPVNPAALVQLQPASETPNNPAAAAAAGLATTAASGSSSSSGSGAKAKSGVFASIFASSSAPVGNSQSSQSPSSFSDMLCTMAGPEHHMAEPVSLSLSSSLYLSNSSPSLFAAARLDNSPHYAQSQQPALSATALLQKAAQIGATRSSSSFLRCLGLELPSSADNQNTTPTGGGSTNPAAPAAQWRNNHGHVQRESNSVAADLGLGLAPNGSSGLPDMMMGPSSLYGNKPATLDLLGLGIGAAGGASTAGFSALLTSMASFGGVNSSEDPWKG
ncbi:zinc finger protein GAI-ASSOCIATED FACTOR 1-like [Diospyros lotus]|uniref:zinc finger protein GAI-ASSOCIATED FACTOR 1-like n=1 Tax=Diospyros lotus TaxID=55363 RepID=UPI002256FC82|nr:zinc finger protein GAI-ASSOCIATED FACTOR 1-like [Diospyros lotus]